ncbi:hypothetical protein BCEN4_740117 [Burkholderia cenocepacia]|nr:hypothetical protein BCEN4_740117 [Burkholderia cenocepacia]
MEPTTNQAKTDGSISNSLNQPRSQQETKLRTSRTSPPYGPPTNYNYKEEQNDYSTKYNYNKKKLGNRHHDREGIQRMERENTQRMVQGY